MRRFLFMSGGLAWARWAAAGACALVMTTILGPSVDDLFTQRQAVARGTPLHAVAAPISHFSLLDALSKMLSFVQIGPSQAFGKAAAALSQITQAQLNQASLYRQFERAATYQAQYAAVNQGACETLLFGQRAETASVDTALFNKAMTAARTRVTFDVPSASQLAAERAKESNQEYCSNYAESIGRCQRSVDGMQDADVNITTLLVPSNGETLTPKEVTAANAYIDHVTVPVSGEVLPRSLEQTPSGALMLQEQRKLKARMAMAQHSLSALVTARSPRN